MNILETKQLTKTYGAETAPSHAAKQYTTRRNNAPQVEALRGIDLAVERGEFLAIVGTSGSGKSTLLNLIGGLDVPTSGEVIIDQKSLSSLTDDELTIFRRRKLGFIFQQYNLIPMLTVWENIILPLKLDGKSLDRPYLDELAGVLGLTERLHSSPNELSGGQQQRVAIARALAIKPALILADEPTGNLDSKTSQDVYGLLKVTSERFCQTIVLITHNEEIAQLAGRIIRIEDGRIVGEKRNDGQKANAERKIDVRQERNKLQQKEGSHYA